MHPFPPLTRLVGCLTRLTCLLDDLAATSGVIAGRTVHNYSGSDQSLGIIQEWLSQCAKTHVDCLPDTALAFPETVAMSISWRTQLPTRVIHVGTDSGNSPPFLHIPPIGEVGTYVTLSHCWGNSQPFTTTHATLFDRMSSIDINGLPKSFRDAITITRKIGIAYLWIDSLCIIQNDTRDWERESAKMAEVYGNSYVTLAATASPDGSKGMLFARDTKTKAVLQYPATNSSGSASDSSDLASIIIMPAVMSLIDPLRRSPLNSRGWVVQERILSKRIIHFNSDQIFWDCQQKFLSEDGRYNETISSGRYSRRNLNPKLLTSHGPDSKPTQQTHKSDDSIIAYWLAIVTEFSQKQLTVHADVFPALAGIASLVQKRLGDEYIAGMWRSDLHFELLWTASEAPMRQAKEWRAPSWSWAANIGGISYEYSHSLNEYTNSMTIVSVHTEWSARPMSSTLRHGYLVVEGILEEVSFNPESTMNHFYDTETFYLLPKGNDPDTKDGYNYSWAIFDFEPPSREITIYCLRVCTVDGGQENRVLLLQATRRKENEFRRIGSGRIDKKPGTFGNGQMTLVSII